MKKIISIKETSTTVEIITEMLFNKKIELYKATKDFEIYQIKNSNIQMALVDINNTNFRNKEKEIEYNTQVITNLYNANTLSIDMIITLFDNFVFMH